VTAASLEALDEAAEQLTLVDGILREALALRDRLAQALQATNYARAEIQAAKTELGSEG